MEFDLYSIIAIVVFTSVALVIDLKTRRIPNWLTVSIAASGLVYHLLTGGWGGILISLGGFATGFGILFVLWVIGGGGGGDVKLMGGVGAWMGAFPVLLIFICSAVFTILCTAWVVAWANIRPRVVSDSEAAPGQPLLKMTIPYALPVSMAIWSLLVYSLVKGS